MVLSLLLTFALGLWASEALAGAIPYRSNKAVQIDVRDVPVGKLLFDLFSEQGIPAVLRDNLQGSFTGRFDASPSQIVQTITRQFGLVAYYDGLAVHVTHVSEAASSLLWLEPQDLASVTQFVKLLNADDSRFVFRAAMDEGYLLVTGPPRYVQRVREIVMMVKNSPKNVQGQWRTRVFRLRYAAAADTLRPGTPGMRVEERVVPGVASVLARLMGVPTYGAAMPAPSAAASGARRTRGALSDPRPGDGSSMPDGRDGNAGAPGTPGSPGLARGGSERFGPGGGVPELPSDTAPTRQRRDGLPAQAAVPLPREAERPSAIPSAHTGATGEDGMGFAQSLAGIAGPVVMAEARLNMVIVRDEVWRMKAYEDLIAELDVAPKMVEIEATIVDIDSNRLEQLGVDWRLQGDSFNLLASAAGRGDGLAGGNTPQVGGKGLVAGTIVNGGGWTLTSRLVALAEKGEARIVSRPRVVTVNNAPAVLSNTREINVRVAGERQADLFNVSYGLNLQVTPTVVGNADQVEFRLAVQIEDGNSQSAAVDGVPVINRSGLSTQSLIRQGDSLLIGGYVVEEQSQQNNKVPFLSNLPLVGPLFGERRESRRRTERLFIITPKLVDRVQARNEAIELLNPPPRDSSDEPGLIFSREIWKGSTN
jgi:type III secretion protein C